MGRGGGGGVAKRWKQQLSPDFSKLLSTEKEIESSVYQINYGRIYSG